MKKKLEPIVLEGSPKQRGKIHGEIQKEKIWELSEQEKFSVTLLNMNPDDFVDQFFEDTTYYETVKLQAPDLMEELQGIAEGAGIDHKILFVLNCGDEKWRYLQAKGVFLDPPNNCTSIGANRTSQYPAMQGQNLDTSTSFRGFETLLYVKEKGSDLKSMIITRSGLLGLIGMNNSPIAINFATIDCNSSTTGMPLIFVGRKILQQTNLIDIVKFVKSIQTGAAQNYMFGDKETILDYECSANEFTQFIPYENYQYIYHSNHPYVNKDIIPGYKLNEDLQKRLNFLEYRMRYSSTPISLENMKHILSSHYGIVCYHGYQGYPGVTYVADQVRTWVSVVSVHSDNPEFHIAVGNPCENPYYRYTFDK